MIGLELVGSGRGAARAEDAQGTPTQSNTLQIILVYELNLGSSLYILDAL